MTFLPLEQLSASCRERTQRDALIDLGVFADIRRFANHHTRAVVDEEIPSQLRARMDVNPRDAVRVFGHDARDQRDAEFVKFVRDPVDHGRIDAGIGGDHLVPAERGGIALERGLDVRGEIFADLRDRPEKRIHDLFAAVQDRIVRQFPALRIEQPERLCDLLQQRSPDLFEQLAGVEADVVAPQFLLVEKAGENDILKFLQHGQDQFPFRKLLFPDLSDMRMPGVTLQNRFEDVVDFMAHCESLRSYPTRRVSASARRSISSGVL